MQQISDWLGELGLFVGQATARQPAGAPSTRASTGHIIRPGRSCGRGRQHQDRRDVPRPSDRGDSWSGHRPARGRAHQSALILASNRGRSEYRMRKPVRPASQQVKDEHGKRLWMAAHAGNDSREDVEADAETEVCSARPADVL